MGFVENKTNISSFVPYFSIAVLELSLLPTCGENDKININIYNINIKWNKGQILK